MSGAAERTARTAEEKLVKVEVADARPPEFSDEALAQRLARVRGDRLRYVAAWAHWYGWTGARWEQDTTLDAFDHARAICRAASSEADKAHIKTALASAKTVAAVERLTRADRRIAATVEQWDTHSWLLPTPGGEVDLRRGKLGPAKSEHYITKITPVRPGGKCPLWRAFLARITDGDTELQSYLARVAGYCLTGHTHEHRREREVRFHHHAHRNPGRLRHRGAGRGLRRKPRRTAPDRTRHAARRPPGRRHGDRGRQALE